MKKFIFLCGIFFFAGVPRGLAQYNLYRLSTHILDVTRGVPASDVRVELLKFRPETNEWQLQKAEKTRGKRPYFQLCPGRRQRQRHLQTAFLYGSLL
ncbi:MAG: hydroxyisourate hydrolase [Alphaproteobacteria bacterium]